MKKTAVIICNGEFPKKEFPRYLISTADYIICCDGGTVAYMRASKKIFGYERIPDMIVGDLDSLPKTYKTRFSDRILHISEQEDNDQTKAFTYVMENLKDVGTIHIIAATGLKEDHTVGNMSLLMEYQRMFDLSDIHVDMVSDYSTIFAISNSCKLQIGEGRKISIFSPDNSLVLKSKGLKWPTDEVVFDNWWKATLNRASQDEVEFEFNHKSMVLIILD